LTRSGNSSKKERLNTSRSKGGKKNRKTWRQKTYREKSRKSTDFNRWKGVALVQKKVVRHRGGRLLDRPAASVRLSTGRAANLVLTKPKKRRG